MALDILGMDGAAQRFERERQREQERQSHRLGGYDKAGPGSEVNRQPGSAPDPFSRESREAFKVQVEQAKKMGQVQGVCECLVIANRWNQLPLCKKIMTETNVSRETAQKYAKPETYKTLEQGLFARKTEQRLEQKHSRSL